MAIYHLSVQTISRGQGKSCVAAAAYRAGEKLHDERQELNHDYTKKHDVESEIIAPKNAPNWVYDREKLWNEVDRAETRCNSRTAREINIALPLELSKDQQKELIIDYVKESFVDKGMVADVCFHFNDSNNPHCHVMLTTREIDNNGFTKKNRDWDKKEKVEEWRATWSEHTNKALENAGHEERIDHRSYKEQGIDQVATVHLGKTSSEMKKKGLTNPRVELNNQIKQLNQEKVIALKEYKELKAKLEQEKTNEAQRYSNLRPEEKAIVKKAEGILKEPQTYENSNRALSKLSSLRKETTLELSKIDSEAKEIEKRIFCINDDIKRLKMAQNEFKGLNKTIFGQYKDKNRAEILKFTIETCEKNLANNGYRNSLDIKNSEAKLNDLQNSIQDLKSKIKVIDSASNVITQGVKALQNKELREFYKDYKEVFPQARYFRYNDMQLIKNVNKLMGRPAPYKEIQALYNKGMEKLNDIRNELTSLKDEDVKIKIAKRAIETIDKYKVVAEKWDTKLIGKAKYQEEHRAEKLEYDDAITNLKTLGVKNKVDIIKLEREHDTNVKEVQPKLEATKENISVKVSILEGALKVFDSALRAERQQQNKEQSKLTKAFRSKYREDELER